jgi:hypothetical protein
VTPTCAICERTMAEQAWADQHCADRAATQLAEIAALVPDARAVAYGQTRRDTAGGTGKPGSRSPGNDDALDALAAVTNALTTICRDIAEIRGAQIAVDGSTPTDPLTRACAWLSGQLEWTRHATDEQGGPYAAAVFAEIDQCARRLRSVIDGPGARKYLGPCGYVETPEECTRYGIGEHDCAQHEPCDGDVYGRPGGGKGTCRTCGATVKQAERRAWLDGEVRNWAYRASEIEDAYGVSANLIRQWATPARDLVQVHGHDRDGRALYLLSQVLDVARGMAAKREETRAKRARRTAARAAESESVA